MSARSVNIAVDVLAFVGFLLAAQPDYTGLRNHEWIGLAISATMVVHLLLHRAWVASVVRRFLGTVATASRVNLLIDALMGASAVIVAVTGVALSRTLLSAFGIVAAHGGAVLELHEAAAEILTVLLLVHLVLHRVWIWRAAVSIVAGALSPVLAPFRRVPVAALTPARAGARARARA
jgi:hypothetical protein